MASSEAISTGGIKSSCFDRGPCVGGAGGPPLLTFRSVSLPVSQTPVLELPREPRLTGKCFRAAISIGFLDAFAQRAVCDTYLCCRWQHLLARVHPVSRTGLPVDLELFFLRSASLLVAGSWPGPIYMRLLSCRLPLAFGGGEAQRCAGNPIREELKLRSSNRGHCSEP